MEIQNPQSINTATNSKAQASSQQNNNKTEVNFADELNNTKQKENDKAINQTNSDDNTTEREKITAADENCDKDKLTQDDIASDALNKEQSKTENTEVNYAIDGLKNTVNELLKVNQKVELSDNTVKKDISVADKDKKEDEDTLLIDNNMNIQEQPELLNAQTSTNMNFNSNGQPFSQFINTNKENELSSSATDLAEEKSILSTMEENIAIARKNMMLKNETKAVTTQNEETVKKDYSKTVTVQNEEATKKDYSRTVTVQNEEGIKKVDSKTHITVDTIVKYDNVIMDEKDVNFFTNLVENGTVNMSDVQNSAKSSQVSKALADLLAKAMQENKPVRIDFDNNISIIIRIDRAGKISADFLPSSQIAETYLKENLPLLKQRFDDNNIDYNELNQRKQKQDTQDNRKKGRKDE